MRIEDVPKNARNQRLWKVPLLELAVGQSIDFEGCSEASMALIRSSCQSLQERMRDQRFFRTAYDKRTATLTVTRRR